MPRLSRHALDLRLRTRKEWLAKAGVTPEAFAKAVRTMLACMDDEDSRVRVRAAIAFAELVRHTVGLTADAQVRENASPSQVAVIVNVPAWLTPKLESPPHAGAPPHTPQNLGDQKSA